MIHDFDISHDREQQDTLAPGLRSVLRQLYPTACGWRLAPKGSDAQRSGIDLYVDLAHGATVTLDFKFRGEVYQDFCLEYAHDFGTELRPGWVSDPTKKCDAFAYIFKPTWTCWLLPRAPLQRAWAQRKDQWQRDFGCGHSDNKSWTTLWCAVPIEVVCLVVRGIRVGNAAGARALWARCSALEQATDGASM